MVKNYTHERNMVFYPVNHNGLLKILDTIYDHVYKEIVAVGIANYLPTSKHYWINNKDTIKIQSDTK